MGKAIVSRVLVGKPEGRRSFRNMMVGFKWIHLA
jgi:hypothetical protein